MSGSPVLLFLDFSGGEILLIMFVVFLVFGPEKMPEMARKAGRLMNQMKKATSDLTHEFTKETSSIQNEINNAHSQIGEQLGSVSRELSSTKAQIVNELNIETNPAPTVATAIPAQAVVAEKQAVAEPPKTETSALKSE